ncbi:hypothetical protein ElyMa_002746800 [Elysia marginata]|uniref:Uncharacterized protein n=1 Tax=Elysia marginata TaxID=1093978 RepID=A0AAV4HIQ5_9GAST|nr:hypothetical protein ElyMa_002746800 [Elysia marginata]
MAAVSLPESKRLIHEKVEDALKGAGLTTSSNRPTVVHMETSIGKLRVDRSLGPTCTAAGSNYLTTACFTMVLVMHQRGQTASTLGRMMLEENKTLHTSPHLHDSSSQSKYNHPKL